MRRKLCVVIAADGVEERQARLELGEALARSERQEPVDQRGVVNNGIGRFSWRAHDRIVVDRHQGRSAEQRQRRGKPWQERKASLAVAKAKAMQQLMPQGGVQVVVESLGFR
jgi:hypothetical protein